MNFRITKAAWCNCTYQSTGQLNQTLGVVACLSCTMCSRSPGDGREGRSSPRKRTRRNVEVKECACKEEGSMWARASIAVALHRVESTELSQVKSSRIESSRVESSRLESQSQWWDGRGRQRHCAEVKRLNSPATLRVKRLNCRVTTPHRKTARAVVLVERPALKAERDASEWKRVTKGRPRGARRREEQEYRPCQDVSTKGCKGKSTVAWIRAIVAFNDSFRDRSGISYNPTFRLPSWLRERLPLPRCERWVIALYWPRDTTTTATARNRHFAIYIMCLRAQALMLILENLDIANFMIF